MQEENEEPKAGSKSTKLYETTLESLKRNSAVLLWLQLQRPWLLGGTKCVLLGFRLHNLVDAPDMI